MSGTRARLAQSELAEAYVARIAVHLARLAAGHDPFGHLFSIERLARAARAEWTQAERGADRRENGR